MAEIDFKCPECSTSVKSDDSLCGEFMSCPSCSSEITIPIPGLVKGIKLGDFEILKKLGSGSMGEVWLAYQKTMDRKVALKILAPKYASDSKFIARFMSEVKHSAKLSHPNIVTAFYAGTDKGHYYLAISYVSGNTVESIQNEKGIFREHDALTIILSIVNALEYAWNEFKILHRDVKPGNIMINKNGEAMLLDLGIAKSLNEESNLTMTGTVVGTPYYISPEQAMAETDIDFRADIYSLGVTLYHMMSGRVPYNGTTAMAIIMKHLNDDFPPPRKYNPELSSECSKLIEIMMSKERQNRQRSWGELRKDIESVMDGKMPETTISSDETIIAEKSTEKKKVKSAKSAIDQDASKNFIIVAIAVVAVLILVIGLIGVMVAIKYFGSSEYETSQVMVGTPSPKEITQVDKNKVDTNKKGITTTAKNNPDSLTFNAFCDQLLSQTSLGRKTFWEKYDNKNFTWSGKVVYVKGRSGKYEIHVNNPARPTYKGFNLILVSYTKDGSVPALKIGQDVVFSGNIYNFRLKTHPVIIIYMKNVIFM